MKKLSDFNLKNYNTFRLNSFAKEVYFPCNLDEFIEILEKKDDAIIIANGSNILFSTKKITTPLIFTNNLDKITLNENSIVAECGVKSAKLALFAYDNSISNFEFLYPIPSFIGGNIVMNAGCHGSKIEDIVIKVTAYDRENKKIVEFQNMELGFSYRNSIFKENPKKYAILKAEFKKTNADKAEIKAKMDRNIEIRKETQPLLNEPNAGSIFKNPENESAGRLLDLSNMKNEKVGGAVVYHKHANFIINANNATSCDIINLISKMQNSVYDNFKIKLIPELILITDDEEEKKQWIKIKK